MSQWNGKVVVITGGGSGVGRSSAILAAERGAKVVIGDVNKAGAEETLGLVKAKGGTAIVVAGDVSVEADAKRLIGEAEKAFGRIDYLFNIAGIMRRHAALADWPLDEWRKIIDVNLTALFMTTQLAAPLLAKQGGAIVNISSVGALWPVGYSPAYSASKAGVLGMTRSLAPQLKEKGVRLNAVLPYLINTPFIRDPSATGLVDQNTKDILDPAEVAGCVAWVADQPQYSGTFVSVGKTGGKVGYSIVQDPPTQTPVVFDAPV